MTPISVNPAVTGETSFLIHKLAASDVTPGIPQIAYEICRIETIVVVESISVYELLRTELRW